ncbi:hypothetical protein Pmar_PMAR028789 [Perkinsus marinus ATCC 50983]|uniref:Uncharacterized protein n=1 Tax=Perkinsus marinus (strain ATCC 50983 / TXsc) TaxID=423536 RepID=C5LRQ7_PERM5|nr:hypothetical protein Pmar_PMAR028789 [Perkinsus marinus ATCC 50983]EER00585.1 hypothetical protein Pmar_PMAR028789 [Perkinsus marinus ATCC 50983]|eukprot:XP_002767867.1 hypothetical protein Pmar_PMAR028789 [Perkinsus marinus ATCC 50983]
MSTNPVDVLSSLLTYLRDHDTCSQQSREADASATRKCIESALTLLEYGGMPQCASTADLEYLRGVMKRRWIDQNTPLSDRAEQEKLLWQRIVSVTREPSTEDIDIDDICETLITELHLTRSEALRAKRQQWETVVSEESNMTKSLAREGEATDSILSRVITGRAHGGGGQLNKG